MISCPTFWFLGLKPTLIPFLLPRNQYAGPLGRRVPPPAWIQDLQRSDYSPDALKAWGMELEWSWKTGGLWSFKGKIPGIEVWSWFWLHSFTPQKLYYPTWGSNYCQVSNYCPLNDATFSFSLVEDGDNGILRGYRDFDENICNDIDVWGLNERLLGAVINSWGQSQVLSI